jgi:hypothetical protein
MEISNRCMDLPVESIRYGWLSDGLPRVAQGDLEEISSLYRSTQTELSSQLSVALGRLNACLTRDNCEDAILDEAVGLEVLLGDAEPSATSYKLRMRAAALVKVDSKGGRLPVDIMQEVNAKRNRPWWPDEKEKKSEEDSTRDRY